MAAGQSVFALRQTAGLERSGVLRLVVGAAASAQVGWMRRLQGDRLYLSNLASQTAKTAKTGLGPREIRSLDLSTLNRADCNGTTGRRGRGTPLPVK